MRDSIDYVGTVNDDKREGLILGYLNFCKIIVIEFVQQISLKKAFCST